MGDRRPTPWARYMVALGILILGLIVAMIFIRGEEEEVGQVGQVSQVGQVEQVREAAEVAQAGCGADQDCGPGRICAQGGCLILISSEFPEVWHEDLAVQTVQGAAWKPADTFGEKVLSTKKCPPEFGNVARPQEAKIEITRAVTVFELGAERTRVLKHIRFVGEVWIDSIRFWFPELKKIHKPAVCGSDEVDHVAIGQGSLRGSATPYIDSLLLKAVPVGTAGAAAVSADFETRPKKDGTSSLKLSLNPVFKKDARYYSVVAVPLGFDVLAIKGPPPTQQRLLTGFSAYYWEHGKSPSAAEITYRAPKDFEQRYKLDATSLNP